MSGARFNDLVGYQSFAPQNSAASTAEFLRADLGKYWAVVMEDGRV
jgi:hypothetical protein